MVIVVHDRLSWKLLVISALAVIGFMLAGGLVVQSALKDAAATQLRADLAPLNLATSELRDALRDVRIKPNARNSAALKAAAQSFRQAAADAQSELEIPESLRRTTDEAIAALAPAEALVRQEGAAPFLLKAGDASDRLSAAIEAVSNLDTRLAVGEVLAVDNAADIQAAIVAKALSSQSVLTPDQRTQLETTLPTEKRTIHQYEDFVQPELTSTSTDRRESAMCHRGRTSPNRLQSAAARELPRPRICRGCRTRRDAAQKPRRQRDRSRDRGLR